MSARWLLDNTVFSPMLDRIRNDKYCIGEDCYYYYYFYYSQISTFWLYKANDYEIRKSSWCKGKLAAAVRDEGPYRRSLQQINECDFQWLIVTVAVLLNVCEMSHMEVENRRFRLLYSDVDPIGYCWYCCSEGTPSNISVIYTSLKSTFSGLQLCCWQYTCLYSLFM